MLSHIIIKERYAIKKSQIETFLVEYGIVVAFLLLLIIVSVLNPNFWSIRNLRNVIRLTSINGLLSLGLTFVILTGGIDLSVGKVMGAAGLVTAMMVKAGVNLPWWFAVLAGLSVGLAIGIVNGLIISYLNIPPFVATLGMQSIAGGFALWFSKAKPIPNLSDSFLLIGTGNFLSIPIPTWIMLAFTVVYAYMLYKRPFGRYVFAVGGNEEAAIASGINVRRVKFCVYAISGLCAALAGIVLTARVSSGISSIGDGYETDAIASVVIGGTSLAGGRGRLWGTIIGILFMTVMNNIMDLVGISPYAQLVIKGCIIILAVMLDSFSVGKEK